MTLRSCFTPRTRHIATKWHWFLDQIGEGKGVVIEYIESYRQRADILTKGLSLKLFAPLRDRIMGWTLHDPPPPPVSRSSAPSMIGSTATCLDPRGVLNEGGVDTDIVSPDLNAQPMTLVGTYSAQGEPTNFRTFISNLGLYI
jgi:hypothetical protein